MATNRALFYDNKIKLKYKYENRFLVSTDNNFDTIFGKARIDKQYFCVHNDLIACFGCDS